MDSCPDVIYRFEPFHRLAPVEPAFRVWLERLKRQEIGEGDVPDLYSLLGRAHPLTNKPPFFPGKSYPLRTLGRRQAWPLARAFRPAGRLYEAIYSPQSGPPIIFKEVTFLAATRNLVERTSVPVVYLVRHPCATVLSEIAGQRRGNMPSARQRNLRRILEENAPALAERYSDVLSCEDPLRREALLWRFEVESCVPLVRQSPRGLVLTYEQLAVDTHEAARKLLAHFGLRWSEQTAKFIDDLLSIGSNAKAGPRRTGWGDRYFSIYRNPRNEKDAWKSRISGEDRRKVESIVAGSEAVDYCAALGRWE